jgi:hypothetical protein
MSTESLLIGVPYLAIDADDADPVLSAVFALPARTVVLSWSAELGATPASIDLAFEVGMDLAGPFVSIDTADETDFTNDAFFRTISAPTAARFGRITGTNGDDVAVTIQVLAKVANP